MKPAPSLRTDSASAPVAAPGRASAPEPAGAPHRTQRRPKASYLPALDGIRTLAVAAVVLYHLDVSWTQGGMLGVTMFFVLSGFLITRLLLHEFDSTHRIDLKSFWLRRVRRLVPAIVTVVVVTAALCTVFNHVMLTKMRPDILPSLLFFSNWWQIIHNVSYFNAVGDPSPLTHFWSLAIEEQFYLVWPPVLLALLTLRTNRVYVRRGVLALAAVSALAMALLYNPAVDPSRLYYGTDTRAFSLLLGAWLAFVPSRALEPAELSRSMGSLAKKLNAPTGVQKALTHAPLLDIAGVASLLGLLAMIACTNGYSAFPYRGGTLLCSLLTLVLVAACTRRESPLTRFFSLPPLVWLGKRSYSIYLWHYPLLLLMNPASNVSDTPWWMTIIQLMVVLVAAECSYRFIETPFRRGAFGRLLRNLRQGAITLPAWAKRHAVPLAACAVVSAVALGGIALVPETSALSEEGAALLQQEDDGSTAGGKEDGQQTGNESAASQGEDEDDGLNEDGFPKGSYDILMVGDSVSLRAVPYFESTFPHGHIDALKNRQFTAGIDVYQSYVDQGLAGKIAVFALGTNGLVTDAQIDQLMQIVGEDRIAVFVNTRAPDPWIDATNQAIANAAARYRNIRVVDWHSYSAGNNALFDGDGTHLTESGAQAYVQLVYDAVAGDLPEHEDEAQ